MATEARAEMEALRQRRRQEARDREERGIHDEEPEHARGLGDDTPPEPVAGAAAARAEMEAFRQRRRQGIRERQAEENAVADGEMRLARRARIDDDDSFARLDAHDMFTARQARNAQDGSFERADAGRL